MYPAKIPLQMGSATRAIVSFPRRGKENTHTDADAMRASACGKGVRDNLRMLSISVIESA
jgi:hypothetical protein